MSQPAAQATLSPSSSTGAAGGARFRKPIPLPAGLRPKKSDNQLPVLNLIHVPKRILIPPKQTGFASVRSFKSTPLSDIRLADVIANKHLSPLSLKDFEGYLAFVEHSAENLYCLLWLNEYTKEWKQWHATAGANSDPVSGSASLPVHLAEYLRRGLDTFFTSGGPLELNLSSKTRGTTLVAAGSSGNPDDFTEARDIIEHSLKHSLALHGRACVANAGPRRLVFCFSLGLSIFLLGLIPALVGILGNHARAWRAIGLPFICFGASVSVMALKRICGVIWLLGEDRQLLPNELAPPKLTSGSLVPLGCPSTPSTAHSTWDSESTYSNEKSEKSDDTVYPWEADEKLAYGDAGHTTISFSADPEKGSSRPASYHSGGGKDLVPHSAPVFGPITKVYSSDVARAQWALVIQSLLWGSVVMCIVGSVLMAVPNKA